MSTGSVLGQQLHGAPSFRLSSRSRTSSGSVAGEDKLRSRRPRSNTANTPPSLVKPGLIQPVSLRGRRASLLGSIAQIPSSMTNPRDKYDLHRPDYNISAQDDEGSLCLSHHSGGTSIHHRAQEDDIESHSSRSKTQ
jgi:hypothetical protein